MTSDSRGSAEHAARDIAAKLQQAGHQAYFAGGCVRDQLLGRQAEDFDIATSADPSQVQKVFPRARGVGEFFGVMLVYKNGWPVQVAGGGPPLWCRWPAAGRGSDPTMVPNGAAARLCCCSQPLALGHPWGASLEVGSAMAPHQIWSCTSFALDKHGPSYWQLPACHGPWGSSV